MTFTGNWKERDEMQKKKNIPRRKLHKSKQRRENNRK